MHVHEKSVCKLKLNVKVNLINKYILKIYSVSYLPLCFYFIRNFIITKVIGIV